MDILLWWEDSTNDSVPWGGPEDIPFPKVMRTNWWEGHQHQYKLLMGSALTGGGSVTELGLLIEVGMVESQNNRRLGVTRKCQKPGDSNYCNDPPDQRGSQGSQNHTKLQRLLVIYNFPWGKVDRQPTWELFSLYWQKQWRIDNRGVSGVIPYPVLHLSQLSDEKFFDLRSGKISGRKNSATPWQVNMGGDFPSPSPKETYGHLLNW